MESPAKHPAFSYLGSRGPSARTTSLLLGAAAAVHVYWAAGGVWPAAGRDALAETVIGPGARFPSAVATYSVAVVLTAGALVVAGADREWRRPVSPKAYRAAARVGAAILGLRGAAGLATSLAAGLDAPYYRWDAALYSPLCLLLAAGAWRAGRDR